MSPPQAKNFENFAHFRVLRSNLAKSLTTGRLFWGGGGGPVVKILGGPKHTLAHPLKFLGGPWAPWPPRFCHPCCRGPGKNHYNDPVLATVLVPVVSRFRHPLPILVPVRSRLKKGSWSILGNIVGLEVLSKCRPSAAKISPLA